MSFKEEDMARQCFSSSSVRKVVTAAILLLILEVNMIAIYTYTMVDNSDLPNVPKKEDIVVRVKRIDMDYLNTVTESTISNILSSVKHSLHMDTRSEEPSSSGDGQFPAEEQDLTSDESQSIRLKQNNKTSPSHFHKKKPRIDPRGEVSVLPSFYIIGAKTSGAETLRNLLSNHPRITTTTSTHHFENDEVFRKGDRWYRNQLPRVTKKQRLVEVDEELFSLPNAPFRLKRRNPAAKFILILRDPLERTLADFLTVHKGLEGSGEQNYEASFVNSDGVTVNEQSPIVSASLYDVHLKNWLSVFNFSQLLLVDYYQLMTQPYAVMNKVEKFLGVEPFYRKSSFTYVSKNTLCTHGKKIKASRVCLKQDHPDLILPGEIDEAMKSFYTEHMDSFWTLVSNDVSVTQLVSLIN